MSLIIEEKESGYTNMTESRLCVKLHQRGRGRGRGKRRDALRLIIIDTA